MVNVVKDHYTEVNYKTEVMKKTIVKKTKSAKNAKLAAMAAPKDKITRADIITAAKKNGKKK